MATRSKEQLVGVTTVGKKGQLVIPADIRTTLRLTEGTKMMAITHGKGILLLRSSDLENIVNHMQIAQTVLKRLK